MKVSLCSMIYEIFKQLGFCYKGNFEQLNSPIDGSIVQADGIIIKSIKER
jgi:hypothetical protein